MLRKSIINKSKTLGLTFATILFSAPIHAYQQGYGGTYGDSGGDSSSGMGMGMGSGSGSYTGSGYNYQRPPRPPMRPFDYQRSPMPPMRPYGYQRPPMPPMRPYGYQRPPMTPMPSYGYRSAPMTPPASSAAPSAPAEQAGDSITAKIQGMAFQPLNLTVKAGATVTWVNNDNAPHTVTGTNTGLLASGTLNRGDRYSITFDQPGTYNYYCKFHPNMRASITVE
ncbi:MAG: cupredoxin family copper-binding protein [Gammaproteobacteria bacterium]|nr:cupredoxin family copper-binding protein [Gammaproteobacteria bacterium]